MKLKNLMLVAIALFGSLSFAVDNRIKIEEAGTTKLIDKAGAIALVFDSGALYKDEKGNTGVYTRTAAQVHGLCSDEKFASSPAVFGGCTGFLINRKQMITSASCIKGPAQCQNKKIYFGFNRDSDDMTKIDASRLFSCTDIDGSVENNLGGSYRVITLDREVDFVEPFEIETRQMAVNTEVYTMSHSHGLALRYSSSKIWESNPRWKRVRAGLSAIFGSEGAPVLSMESGKVIGVLNSSLNSHVKANPFRGCNELKICSGQECFLEIIGTADLFSKYAE